MPTFFTARPSSKGLFYLPELKWNSLGLTGIKETWDTIGIKFEEGKDEVSRVHLECSDVQVFFFSMSIDRTAGTLTSSEVVCQGKLMLDVKTAKVFLMHELVLTLSDSDPFA